MCRFTCVALHLSTPRDNHPMITSLPVDPVCVADDGRKYGETGIKKIETRGNIRTWIERDREDDE